MTLARMNLLQMNELLGKLLIQTPLLAPMNSPLLRGSRL
jgi:hypothetical protein